MSEEPYEPLPQEEPPAEEPPPPAPGPAQQRWPLAEQLTLAGLDRDYPGEVLFCRATISSLKETLARHATDHAVESAYQHVLLALEDLIDALDGSATKMAAHDAWVEAQTSAEPAGV